MRVEPHTVGSIVHVMKRGARGMPITRDRVDQGRFLKLLYYLNDGAYRNESWERATDSLLPFEWPAHWSEREPLVNILAWTLMPNHFHIVLKALCEEGIPLFMKKLCVSMTGHFNAKYEEKGSIFQGAYRGRTAELHGDEYLRYLPVYVMVKNPFELYPGGFPSAVKNFDDAFAWAAASPLCSLGAYAGGTQSPILEKDIFGELFETPAEFKTFARDCMESRLELLSDANFD